MNLSPYYVESEVEPGDPVFVYGYVAGRPGPHKATVLAVLRSGRVRVLVPMVLTRTLVIAVVDPSNLYPRVLRAPVAPTPRTTARTARLDAYVRFNIS